MDVLWTVKTNKDTLFVWAKDREEANMVAQWSLHFDEKIVSITR